MPLPHEMKTANRAFNKRYNEIAKEVSGQDCGKVIIAPNINDVLAHINESPEIIQNSSGKYHVFKDGSHLTEYENGTCSATSYNFHTFQD